MDNNLTVFNSNVSKILSCLEYDSSLLEGAVFEYVDEYLRKGVSKSDIPFPETDFTSYKAKAETIKYFARLTYTEEKTEASSSGNDIVYISGQSSDMALDAFSDYLSGGNAFFSEDYKSIADDLFFGRHKYGIFPVYDSKEGYLSVFRKLFFKSDLCIVSTVSVEYDERITEYALVSSSQGTGGDTVEIVTEADRCDDIIILSKEFGCSLESVMAFTDEDDEGRMITVVKTEKPDDSGPFAKAIMIMNPNAVIIGRYSEIK